MPGSDKPARRRREVVDPAVVVSPVNAGNSASVAKRAAARMAVRDEVVRLYSEGYGAEYIAARVGFSDPTVRRILRDAGVPIRDRSQAGKSRWKSRPDEALAQAQRGGYALRGRRLTDQQQGAVAAGKQRAKVKVGAGEELLAAWLMERSVETTPQLAVDRYNIDLAVEPVAIEVHVTAHHPESRPKAMRRQEHLLNRGWRVLFVWVTGRYPLTESCADEVVALVDLACRDPAAFGQYRVIRGNGEFARREGAFVGRDRDHVPDVPPSSYVRRIPR